MTIIQQRNTRLAPVQPVPGVDWRRERGRWSPRGRGHV